MASFGEKKTNSAILSWHADKVDGRGDEIHGTDFIF